MKTLKALTSYLILSATIFCLQHCGKVGPKPPPPGAVLFRAFYKDKSGSDLLDSQIAGSYKEKDIRVISIVEKDGIQKEINLDEKGVLIDYDNDNRCNYLGVWIPTSYNEKPIATYIYLSSADVDTINYKFLPSTSIYPYWPDSVFYNKKLVWQSMNIKPEVPQSFSITK